ncbi:MAG: DEAD/DEAH box helicase [Pirellulaceae bacterium]|nr:MAG: DEAD/DEAH box helicase [Pirellulaceae bacterium]
MELPLKKSRSGGSDSPKKPAKPATPSRRSDSGFAELGVSEGMLAALEKAGYLHPTPIQASLIPVALQGRDCLGQAPTGTGKTAAFVIPILEALRQQARLGRPSTLILVPTRELARQVADEIKKLAAGLAVRVALLYGGQPIGRQIDTLRRGAHVAVGTPGRILDHLGRGTLKLGQVQWVVLDEADRMLDIGFRPDIERILEECPKERQTILLSATVPGDIRRLAATYMRDPVFLDCSPPELTVSTIAQYYFIVDAERKLGLLLRLLDREEPRQAIIFCRTRRRADVLYHQLKRHSAGVGMLQGDMPQAKRERVMMGFRQGKIRYLVATDIVGRGIDVTGVSHIINYDIPEFCDDYVHRVGRTGRMGRSGVAYTFVTPFEGHLLAEIEERIGQKLQRQTLEDYVASTLPVPEGPPPPPPGSSRTKRRYRRAL